jgi:hypothetical protein
MFRTAFPDASGMWPPTRIRERFTLSARTYRTNINDAGCKKFAIHPTVDDLPS